MNKRPWSSVLHENHRIWNYINLLRKQGSFICPNGQILSFTRSNQIDIKKLYRFSLIYGVNFSNRKGCWNYEDGIITTPNGIRFKIDNFDSLIFAETFLSDIHFSDVNLKDKIVIQAGGFIGDTALYYASRGAKVYSFEPDINSYNLALENIKLNPELSESIVMRNYAVGSDEEIDFPITTTGSGGSSAYNLKGMKTVKIKSVSVSAILDEFSINEPFLLDLDIKGKEFEVIKDDSIPRFKMVRIEYSTMIGNNKIGTRDEILNRLRELGFKNIRIFKHNGLAYDLEDHGTIETIRD